MATFVPHSHTPYGSDGSGFYTDSVLGVFLVIQEASQLVLKSLKNIPVVPGEVFVIADLGTADGGTSMPLFYTCVAEIRKMHSYKLPIHIMYEDQPINDFKSLFLRLQGLIPGPPSYFKDFENVFVSACGTNFFSQCFPPNTVHLAFSSTAMHWLRKRPCHISGAIHHTMITNSKEKEMYSRQAAEDWEDILLQRAKEIKPGGRFICVQLCVDEEGQCLGYTKNVKVHMHKMFSDLWEGMVKDETITQEEFDSTEIINYYRTVDEFKAPFQSENSAVRKTGLSLLSIETKVVRCCYHEKWMAGNKEDPKAHAKWYIPTLRVWSNGSFMSGLSENRSPEEKTAIVDELYKRYEEQVARNPDDHAMDYVHAYIVIEKGR